MGSGLALFLNAVAKGSANGATFARDPNDPFHFSTSVGRDKSAPGLLIRRFDGPAAPPASVIIPGTAERIDFHARFPNPRDPFPVNTTLKLGNGGFGLRTVDRGLMGVVPGDNDAPWHLNMIPFGVAVDGSIMDPSGPWYDGGPADPNNPFDHACTGWEYEVTHPDVMALVGVPAELQGHVQPGGLFHYHGYPSAIISVLRARPRAGAGPLVVGYSADGFPIIDYRVAAPDGSEWVLVSGYVLREGRRRAVEGTHPAMTPPGSYDGLYVEDYEFAPDRKRSIVERALREEGQWRAVSRQDASSGKARLVYLDANNALVLGDAIPAIDGYPKQQYAYVLTPDWPRIPRRFAFEPDESFRNVIPFETKAIPALLSKIGIKVQPARSELYANCPATLRRIHAPFGRRPY
jgi:hypothetical protein